MTSRKVLLSWSSGKDAAFALHRLRQQGEVEVVGLPPGVAPCGERGEFHTFAWEGPMFSHPIAVTPGQVVERDGFVYAGLVPA